MTDRRVRFEHTSVWRRRALWTCMVVGVVLVLGAYRVCRAAPEAAVVEIQAGETRFLVLDLTGASSLIGSVIAKILPSTDGEWPDVQLLDIGFETGGAPRNEQSISLAGANPQLRLKIEAGACCPSGEYERVLEVRRSIASGTAVSLPLVLEVESAGLRCWWSKLGPVFPVVPAAVIFVLALPLLSAHEKSSFIDRKALAWRLVPLEWTDYGKLRPRAAGSREQQIRDIEAHLAICFPWRKRALNWLRANPFHFGLFGTGYNESIKLKLGSAVDILDAELIPSRGIDARCEKNDLPDGCLFVTAKLGLTFLATPDQDKKVDQKSLKGAGRIEPGRCVVLRRGVRLLIPRAFGRTRSELAGWQLADSDGSHSS